MCQYYTVAIFILFLFWNELPIMLIICHAIDYDFWISTYHNAIIMIMLSVKLLQHRAFFKLDNGNEPRPQQWITAQTSATKKHLCAQPGYISFSSNLINNGKFSLHWVAILIFPPEILTRNQQRVRGTPTRTGNCWFLPIIPQVSTLIGCLA